MLNMLKSSLVSSVSLRGDYLRNCFRPSFKSNLKLPRNKGAILVLIWSFLGFSVYHYFTMNKISRDPTYHKINPGEKIAIVLLLPVGGWLADAFFGRYRVICFGLWTMWFGAMLNGFSLVIGKVIETYGSYGDPWVSLFSKVIMGAGLGAYLANIVQFGVDQLIDASSTEIISFIEWYTITTFISGVMVYFSSYCSPEYVGLLVISVYLSLALVSAFFVSQWLTKEQVVSNPFPLILKVVRYTIKTKYQQGRKMNRVIQHGVISSLNTAKTVYNGPFTDEQVENVKTFFRVVVVAMVFSTVSSGAPTVIAVTYQMAQNFHTWPGDASVKKCYEGLNIYYSTFSFVALVVLFYQLVLRPLLHNCIPNVSITGKFLVSVMFFFVGVMALLGIETASYLHQLGMNQTSFKCDFQHGLYTDISVYWVMLPSVLNGLSVYVFVLSGIEFVCAQAPFNMKGVVLGIACALFGFGTLSHAAISQPFLSSTTHVWKKAPLTCGIWYFMMEGVIVLVGFILVVVIVKTYKRRTRIAISSQNDWQESGSYMK